MTDTPDVEDRLEFGYRMPSGEEFWVTDHGTDGAWTPYVAGRSLPRNIDVDDSTTLQDFARAVNGEATVLYRELRITRTRGPVQEQISRGGTP